MTHKKEQASTSIYQLNYIRQHHRNHRLVSLCRSLILLLFLTLWQVASNLKWIDSFFFSSPLEVIECGIDWILYQNLMHHILITLTETMFSFLLVNVLSILCAFILWYFKKLSDCIEPYLVALNSLPKSAMAPLFLVWLGSGFRTIVIAGISVAVFGSIISCYAAYQQTDAQKQLLLRTLGSTKLQTFRYVVFPSSLPLLLETIKINLGLSLVGVIIGEFLASKEGLGYLIIYGSQVFQLRLVITAIFILCLIAILLYKALEILTHMVKKSRNSV